MTDKEKKSKIADILMDFQEEYSNEVINRPMLASLYAGNILSFIDSLQEEPVSKEIGNYDHKAVMESLHPELKEEPVSEDLEAAMQHNAPDNIGIDDLLYWRNGFIAGAKWQKEKEYTCYEEAFEDGAKWKVENLWKPADGDDFPEIDREVVAFQEIFPTDVDVPSLLKIVIAHRPNPEGYDGKSIATGIVEHYTPKTYGEGGWNIPDVRFWLDVKLPKEIEL